jgi:hypothetical protein
MKARIAAVVLTGILCAAAPAWSDAIFDHAADSATVTIGDSGGAAAYSAPSVMSLVSLFSSDSGKLNFVELEPTHRMWDGRFWRHEADGDPTSPSSSPSTPVSATEPATLPMLALGLMGLLGSALIVSPSRFRRP